MGLLNKSQKIFEVGHLAVRDSSRCDKGTQAVELGTHWTSLERAVRSHESREYT